MFLVLLFMLYLASDHAGWSLKKQLTKYLTNELKMKIEDLGPEKLVENDDFTDYAIPLAKKVSENKNDFGILICGTGHGMCITANKIKGIRAISGYSIIGSEMGRRHNNANVLCLAGKILSPDHAQAIVKKFLETNFEAEERFIRRNKKIEELEK